MLAVSSALGFRTQPSKAQNACQGGVFNFIMPALTLTAPIIWQLQPPHPLLHCCLHFSGLN